MNPTHTLIYMVGVTETRTGNNNEAHSSCATLLGGSLVRQTCSSPLSYRLAMHAYLTPGPSSESYSISAQRLIGRFGRPWLATGHTYYEFLFKGDKTRYTSAMEERCEAMAGQQGLFILHSCRRA